MRLKWGIVGAGLITERNVIDAISKATNSELVALMDVNETRVRDISRKFAIPKSYTKEEDLLEDNDVEAVYVATPLYLHAEQVVRAAEWGKHILCEKPMALTLKECEEMIAACERNKVKLAIGYMMRFHPYHLRIKELLQNKAIGEVIKARFQWNDWYPPGNGVWRHNPRLGGGGCLMDIGSHCVDLARFLMGDVEDVSALTDNVFFKYSVEDISTLILRFKSGPQGIVDNSFARDPDNSPDGIEIYGTKGAITTRKTISCFVGGTMTTLIDGREEKYLASEVDIYEEQIQDFAASTGDKTGTHADGESGMETLKVVLAGYESAKSRKTIRIS